MNCKLILGSFSFLLMAACGTTPPPIANGIHGPFNDIPAEFDRRVRARFPVGSDQSLLHNELERERFVIVRDKDDPFRFTATVVSSDIACRIDWSIHWSEFDGKIGEIAGGEGHVCL